MEWIPPETDVLAPPSDCTKIVYEIQESEFVEAYFNTVLDANARMRLLILICISVIIVGAVLFFIKDLNAALIGTVGVGILAFILVLYFKWRVSRDIRKHYRSIEHSLRGPIELVFGDGFLGSRTPRGLAGTNVLYGTKKLPTMRIFFSIPKVFSVVPLRAFASTLDIEKFDSVVDALSKNGAAQRPISR